MSNSRSNLADVLVRRGLLAAEQMESAVAEAESAKQPIERFLLESKKVSRGGMLLAMAEYLDMTPVSLAHFKPDPDLTELVPQQLREKLQVLPLARCGNMLTVAMGDPFNITATEIVHDLTGLEVVPLAAIDSEVSGLLGVMKEEPGKGLEDVLRDVSEDSEVELGQDREEDVSLDEIMDLAEEAPVIRIVNSIMIEALRKGASDIHIEPQEKSLRLRYRTDGILLASPSPPKRLHPAISSRIKIMSNLNIAERRIPQDGRFKIKALGKECDVRVSILPTVHGEKIVMRILDKSNLAAGLSDLGLEQKAYENFKYAISQPYGMLLVTGPTGSGKTTTLYSCLQDLNRPDVNISTVEDPVEYELPGVNQVHTNNQVGMTFAAALRSLLRQDPDIIMVGEIRDGETAGIAVKAALTGHLVLSTLHTNDSAGAIARLSNMGVEPFLLSSSLIMTQAQRLYRKVCPACRKVIPLPEEVLRLNKMDPSEFDGTTFYAAQGCPKCGNLGYKGRGAVMEILLVDDDIRAQIIQDPNADVIRKIAVANGMKTLRDLGFERVKQGITTVDEVLRVTSGS
jgi:type IV pilus assembly protein PilB